MTPTSALEQIREALKRAKDNLPFTAESYEPALAALSVLEASVLPEMPETCTYAKLSYKDGGRPEWYAEVYSPQVGYGTSASARAAMLAALGGINEKI